MSGIGTLSARAIVVTTALIYLPPRAVAFFSDLYLDAISAGVQAYSSVPFRLTFWVLIGWMFLGPVVAGYLVASISKQAPILHGIVVGAIGLVVWSLGVPLGPVSYEIVRVVLLLGLATGGAWFWTYRVARKSV